VILVKKFFANFLIFLAMLLGGLAAIPWNDLSQWGVSVSYLSNHEVLIKSGIGAFLLIFSLIFLLVANHESKNDGEVSTKTGRAAFLPLYIFAIAMMLFTTSLAYYIYLLSASTTNLIILGALGFITLNLIIFGHIFGSTFRSESNGRRIMHFILLVELVAIGGGIGYWLLTYQVSNYAAFNSMYFAGIVALAIILYIVHSIVLPAKARDKVEEEEMLSEINESGSVALPPKAKSKKKTKKDLENQMKSQDDRKTIIVSKEQNIMSAEKNIDPTNMIYGNVSVDPEFNRIKGSQPNSIEYYIEKPKMFKPLDPTFDELVTYIRQLPHVITKIEDDKITFYVDRKPFIVLMNLGDYYRMAFKYDLEKGIRLIIKYPTISKNKSTRDELWFKANNYGDLPKEVIYQIVKTSYDNVNA
jgi:predicted DNA-binding protein (MmcQ/YjbR family)